jgi:Peptidase family M13
LYVTVLFSLFARSAGAVETSFDQEVKEILRVLNFVKDVITEVFSSSNTHLDNQEESIINATLKIYDWWTYHDMISVHVNYVIREMHGNINNYYRAVFITVSELQSLFDDYLITPSPIVETFLTLMLRNVPQSDFDMENDLILTSEWDVIHLVLTLELIQTTTSNEMELLIWWDVVESMMVQSSAQLQRIMYKFKNPSSFVQDHSWQSKFCTYHINRHMGFATAHLIADKEFPTKVKPKVQQMFQNIRSSFENLVNHADWIDWESREKALKKSENMRSFIGKFETAFSALLYSELWF